MKNICAFNNNISYISNSHKNYNAYAIIKGGPLAPNINGSALLYQFKDGVYIHAYISGIPAVSVNDNTIEFHALHIHEFGNCVIGDTENPFLSAGECWTRANLDNTNCTGTLPPMLANNGVALMSVFTNRFYLKDAIGRSFILHEYPDGFPIQIPGGSGRRLACGTIKIVDNCSML